MKQYFKKWLFFFISLSLIVPIAIQAEEMASEMQPISVLLLGVDTQSFDRVENGRSDVLMVATINPKTKKVTITSIPRDTYTEIVGKGFLDKINHAYAFGGAQMAMDTVNHLLQINLNHYIAVNMAGLEQIIDAVGGVEVIPPTSFTIEGYVFNEGEVTMVDGAKALAYSRERYTSGGDYGRQERQRELIQKIVKKMTSVNSLFNLQKIMTIMNHNIETDLTVIELMHLFTIYRDRLENFELYQLTGYGEMIDGVYYDIPDPETLLVTIQRLQEELE